MLNTWVLTEINHSNIPPGLHVHVQGSCRQKLLGDAFVHSPQQLFGLALVHDGNVLITTNPDQLDYISSLHAVTRVSDHDDFVLCICGRTQLRQDNPHRKVWYLIIRVFLPHDSVQQIAVVLEGRDPQHPAYIL